MVALHKSNREVERKLGLTKRYSVAVHLADGSRRPALTVDGKRCTREQNRWFWRQAKFEATLTMNKLLKAGVITEEDEQANKALHYALMVMKAPVDQKIGLQAASLVLQYTKSKPVQKSEVSISKAEEWLAAVTIDHEQTLQVADQTDAASSTEEAA